VAQIRKYSVLLVFMVLLLVAFVSSGAYGQEMEPADLVLINGKIVTVDEKQPDAEAIAIRKDTIVAVGSGH